MNPHNRCSLQQPRCYGSGASAVGSVSTNARWGARQPYGWLHQPYSTANPVTPSARLFVRDSSLFRTGGALQFEQPGIRLLGGLPAHLLAGAQADAHGRPVGLAVQPAAVIRRQLHTAYAAGLPWAYRG